MTLTELWLWACSITLIIFTPIYFFFRGKMNRKKLYLSNYSKKRVVKLTLINIIIHILSFLLFLSIYFTLMSKVSVFNYEYLVISVMLFLIYGLIFYGGGIYITSIVLEAYTIPELTKSEFFKTQFLAIKLFHHPISHFLVFSGWMLIFLLLAVLDSAIGHSSITHTKTLVLLGSITGFVYAYQQIKNGTAVFQIPTGIFCMLLLLLNFQLRHIGITSTSLGTYFIAFISLFNITMLIHVLSLKLRHKKIIRPVTEIHPIHQEV